MSMCVGHGDVGTCVEGAGTYNSPTQIARVRLLGSSRDSLSSDYCSLTVFQFLPLLPS